MHRLWSSAFAMLVASILIVTVACGSEGNPTTDSASESKATQTNQGEPLQWSSAPAMQLEAGADYWARLTTSKGEMVVDLDETGAPLTVNNFVFLAEQGYYTNVPFHRIISGFMVQTGDPTGRGSGGPGYRFADEVVTKDYLRGTLAMANAGPNTNGSQFFICHVDLTGRLPKNYTIFGQLTEGFDVLDAIASVQVRPSASGEMSSPVEPVTLVSVEIFTK